MRVQIAEIKHFTQKDRTVKVKDGDANQDEDWFFPVDSPRHGCCFDTTIKALAQTNVADDKIPTR